MTSRNTPSLHSSYGRSITSMTVPAGENPYSDGQWPLLSPAPSAKIAASRTHARRLYGLDLGLEALTALADGDTQRRNRWIAAAHAARVHERNTRRAIEASFHTPAQALLRGIEQRREDKLLAEKIDEATSGLDEGLVVVSSERVHQLRHLSEQLMYCELLVESMTHPGEDLDQDNRRLLDDLWGDYEKIIALKDKFEFWANYQTRRADRHAIADAAGRVLRSAVTLSFAIEDDHEHARILRAPGMGQTIQRITEQEHNEPINRTIRTQLQEVHAGVSAES